MIAMAVMPSQAKEIPFQLPDCGLNALFILLELNGHHVELSKLREELPPQTSKGYSFQDLKNAAARLGYDLQGISLHTSSNLPRVPAIVFLSDQKNGHFIVTKPIENSKTLIQVFDAPSQPRIVNEDVLKKDSHWTGRILLMQSNSYKKPILIIISAVLVLILVLQKVFRKQITISVNRQND